jgi:hypothetical protein
VFHRSARRRSGIVAPTFFDELIDVSFEIANRTSEANESRPFRMQPPRAQRCDRQAQSVCDFVFSQSVRLIAIHTIVLADWVT